MRLGNTVHQPRARSAGRLPLGSESHPARACGRRRGRRRWAPELVRLEDRQLLATFTVTSTLDTENFGTPVSGSLRWAVQQADLAGGSATINFSTTLFDTPQTITLNDLLTPIEMTTGANTITIDGPGANLLTINGGNDGSVFQIDSGVAATIEDLTITGTSLGDNGAVDDLGSLTMSNCIFTTNTISGVYVAGTADISDSSFLNDNSYFGAGIYVKGGTATITDCTLSGNTGAVGGGVCNVDGTTTVTDCTLSGDSTLGTGGGLYNNGSLTVTDCMLSGDDGSGAAVYNKSGTLSMSGTTITGSSGFIFGGGLLNDYGATLDLTDCTVSGGTANSGAGLYNGGMATVTDCTFSDNKTSGTGAGISNGPLQPKAVLILTDSTLVGNTSPQAGGGLYNNGTATLTDDTIANNFGSAADGAGISNDGTATLVACTISGNTTTRVGGGIYDGGLGPNVLTLDDTIVAGNFSTSASPAVADDIAVGNGVTVSGSYDLIGPGGSGGLTGTSNTILTDLAGLGLAPLGDYGGPTETMALESNSVAINAGRASIAGVTVPPTDQRGFPLNTPTPDIGAYQTNSVALVVAVTTDGAGAPSGELDLRGRRHRQP